jgi:MFS superfamily sulfate permease-like transporter
MALGKKLKLDKLIPLIDLSENKVDEVVENTAPLHEESEIAGSSESSADLEVKDPVFSFLDPIDTGDMKVEFLPSKRKTQKKIFVHLSGALTIQNVGQMKDRIPLLFDEYDHIELVLKNVTGIDITAIQLFNLMRVNYHSFGKYTYINAELTNDQKKMLTTCGYSEFNTQIAATA